MKRLLVLGFVLIALACLTGCKAEPPTYDIRGDWEYTMIDQEGNTYDTGTITFSGEASAGTYFQTNIYEVNYEGEFTVEGISVELSGDESWSGQFISENRIEGDWIHEGEETQGEFVASR